MFSLFRAEKETWIRDKYVEKRFVEKRHSEDVGRFNSLHLPSIDTFINKYTPLLIRAYQRHTFINKYTPLLKP